MAHVVIQKVLQHGRSLDRDAKFKLINSNNSIIIFLKQKQAGNVVEAMLRLGDANQCQQTVQEKLKRVFLFSGVLTVVIDALNLKVNFLAVLLSRS
jgi:hypothetical protein